MCLIMNTLARKKHKVTGNRNLDNFYVYFGKDTEFSYGHFLEGKYKKENVELKLLGM